MHRDIQIVDLGRGQQLSTSRITVQDLVPYFQYGSTHDEIIRNIPTLTRDEVAVVERYYREHQTELDEEDRRIREEVTEEVRLHRLRFPEPEGTIEERRLRLLQQLARQQQERNGARNPG